MIPNKAGDSLSASRGVHEDFLFTEAPDRPVLDMSGLVEGIVSRFPVGPFMPVIAVGLDDQPSRLEDEVGLETPEHGLVHLEMQSPFLEFVMQKPLDRSHLRREMLPQTGLTSLFTPFRRTILAAICLTYFCSMFRRELFTKVGLTHLLAHFRIGPLSDGSLTPLLTPFRRSLKYSLRHSMFNYSTKPPYSKWQSRKV